MRRELRLQEAAEGERRGEDARRRAHGQEAIPVDRLHPDLQTRRRRGEHRRKEIGREVVRHDDARLRGERREQAPPVARPRLDVRMMEDAGAREGRGVVRHPLQHEGVEAIVRPRVAGAERLEHDQRSTQAPSVTDGPVEREGPRGTAGGRHPVQHVPTVGADGGDVGAADPRVVLSHRRTLNTTASRETGHRPPRPGAKQAGAAGPLPLTGPDPSFAGDAHAGCHRLPRALAGPDARHRSLRWVPPRALADRGAVRSALARGHGGPVHGGRQPGQVAPGAQHVVLRDLPPRQGRAILRTP